MKIVAIIGILANAVQNQLKLIKKIAVPNVLPICLKNNYEKSGC